MALLAAAAVTTRRRTVRHHRHISSRHHRSSSNLPRRHIIIRSSSSRVRDLRDLIRGITGHPERTQMHRHRMGYWRAPGRTMVWRMRAQEEVPRIITTIIIITQLPHSLQRDLMALHSTKRVSRVPYPIPQ